MGAQLAGGLLSLGQPGMGPTLGVVCLFVAIKSESCQQYDERSQQAEAGLSPVATAHKRCARRSIELKKRPRTASGLWAPKYLASAHLRRMNRNSGTPHGNNVHTLPPLPIHQLSSYPPSKLAGIGGRTAVHHLPYRYI